MRALLWIVVIFALAAGLVVAARYNAGYVQVVWPPYRVELSLNLVLVLLAGAFAIGYAMVRVISGMVRLPSRVQAYRAARRRQKAQTTLLEALQEFFAGRYARAERAAASSIKLGDHAALCAVLAARAAHELRAYERRDAYLAQAAELASDDDAVKAVTEAELLLEERRHQDALDALKRLSRKHTAALRLELRAQQALRNWEQVLALIEQLEKRGVFDAEQARQLRVSARVENLKRKALDVRALSEAWQKVPPAERKDAKVAAAAAQCFIALGAGTEAQQIIEQSLQSGWDSVLVLLYAESVNGDALPRIERAEGWLQAQPRDAPLLLTLGRLCARQGLWGKAQSYLEASIAIEPTWSAQLALAQLHEKLGNAEAAHRHARASLDLAVERLRQATGGQRQMPL
ncbi:MAG: heme biosynthesis HemY N-terminal domain-containing protein [Betaproteobacteria bacterium]